MFVNVTDLRIQERTVIHMTLIERIRRLCAERGISVRQLEIATGITERTIGRWDVNTPSVDKVQKVAEYFGVSIDYLMGREGDEDTDSPGKVRVSDEELKFAIFNGGSREITDAMLDEVKQFAEWIKMREAKKNGQDK